MTPIRSLTVAAVLSALASCAVAPPPPPSIASRADAEMERVLAAYQASGAQPVSTLTVMQARSQPTPGDAAAAVAQRLGVQPNPPVARITDIQIPTKAGLLPARVYDPEATRGLAPVILYFHGGGWVTGTLDTYDASCRALAHGTGAIVVSVQYRLGPESRFPAAHDDANAAYAWLLQNAGTINGDPKQIALAGESAGGSLAIGTAIHARDAGLPRPVHELLIYPVAGTDLQTPSYQQTTDVVPLNRAAVQWYVDRYANGPADLRNPRLNVVGAADLAGLPPTTIVSAEIDPLRSEGEALAAKLRSAGVPVEQRTYPGVTHEFFGMGAAVGQARAAEDFASARLRASFQPVPGLAPRRRATPRRAG